MITRLSLTDFGKFKGASFLLRPITLVLGANESGKSTLFDALFDQLCGPRGSTAHGRRLRERYGERRTASLEFDGNPLSFDPDEYLNLLAIGSSDLEVDLAPGRPWLERVKSRLFSGGIDPAHLAEVLDREARTSGNLTQVQRAKRLEAAREVLVRELAEMRGRREALLAREREVRSGSGRIGELEAEIAAREERAASLAGFLQAARARSERVALRETLATVARIEEASRRERELAPYRTDGSAELRALEQGVTAAQSELAAARERRRVAAELRELGERKELDLRPQRETAARRAEVAAQLRRSLEGGGRRRLPPLVVVLIFVGATLVGALAGGLLLSGLVPAIGVGVGALFGAVALLVVALVVLLILQAGTASRASLVAVRDEWRSRLPEAPPLASEGIEGLIDELARYRSAVDEADRRLSDAERERRAAEDGARAALSACEQAEARLGGARAALASWLSERGVATAQAYAERLLEYARVAQTLTGERARIAEAKTRLSAADEASLKAECLVRISRLDDIALEEAPSEPELRRAENERAALAEELERLRGEKERLLAAVSGGLGEVRGSLGDLPDRILGKERERADLDAALAEAALARSAAALARDLVQELARESDILLERLAAEIARSFGDLLHSERPVRVDRLDLGGIAVTDAGGALRPVDALSHGTRDSFLFAARLTLAAQSREGEGILVLDDPFPALDERRLESALAFLARFRERSGWQLILFSKELSIEQSARRVFGEIEVIRLS